METVSKAHVVFIPCPAQSHIKCMLKLARLLHHKGLHITFVNTELNHNQLLNSGGPNSLDGEPGFQFVTIPDGIPDNLRESILTEFLDPFVELVGRLKLENPVTCIIGDGMMPFTVDAAEKLNIPILQFWTFSASAFWGFYQAPNLIQNKLIPLKDDSFLTNGYLDTIIDWIPGFEAIRLKELPSYVRTTNPNDSGYKLIIECAKASSYSLWKEDSECLNWLQSKEPNSVIYVNFGSLISVSLEQLLEFGWGLANSNHYFLWIIRPNLVAGESVVFPPELDEMINRKGYIASWYPQEGVLNHPSVGGFLTYCGWGSTIESLSAGVPMMCWPYLWDQPTICRQICKEWEVPMEIGENVNRDEVEKLTRELIGGEKGKQIRSKAMEWKKMIEIATSPNGSSSLNVEKIANDIHMFSRN